MVAGKFYFNLPPLPSNDICKDVDYKNRKFGLRADGDFWQTALLPFNYRILPLDFLLEVMYGKNHDFEVIPDKGPERKQYFAKDEAQETYYVLGKLLEEERTYREYGDKEPVPGLASFIRTKYHRYYYLNLLSPSDPLYKEVKNFKMKKRKSYIRKLNKYASNLSLPFGQKQSA